MARYDLMAAAACVMMLAYIGDVRGQDAARFSRTGCGSIIDNSSQLEWYIGPDANVSWHDSLSWVRDLRECGGNWQMPSLAELRGLFDLRYTAGTGYYTRDRYWPAHLHPIFSGIGRGSWVWANEIARRSPSGGPAFNFNQGINVVIEPGRDFTVRAFAVRRADIRTPPAEAKQKSTSSPTPATDSGSGTFVNPSR
jgi:hypothetical protein